MSQTAPTYKVLLLGDAGVGKTTFMRRHLTGEYDTRYTPTQGCELLPLTFFTTHGPVTFNVCDVPGHHSDTPKDTYYANSQGAILMFDVTSPVTYSSVRQWHQDVTKVCGDLPVVLCGSKVDKEDREVPAPTDTSTQLQYYDISSKSNYNFEKPFIYLARQLCSQPGLRFVSWCGGCVPPVVDVDPVRAAQLDKELQNLQAVPLPDDDDL